MKKLIIGMVVMAAMVVQAEVKLGVADTRTLLRNHKAYDMNKELVAETEKKCEKRCEVVKNEIEKLQEQGKKLADEYRNPMLAPAAKAKIESELSEIQKKYMELSQQLRGEMMRGQQEVSDLEQLLLKKQGDDLRKVIAEYAKANGYTFIFDAQAALYAEEGTDVTDGILRAMGVDPEKAVRPTVAEKEVKKDEVK